MYESGQRTIAGLALLTIGGMMLVAMILYSIHPNDQVYIIENETSKMVAFKRVQNGQARIGYEIGECGSDQFAAIINRLRQEDTENYFFPIPANGTRRYNEYVNLLYIHYFDKIICSQGEFYVARFAIRGADCDYTKYLKECGSDLLRKDTYQNMVYWLVNLGLGEERHWKPRNVIESSSCECKI